MNIFGFRNISEINNNKYYFPCDDCLVKACCVIKYAPNTLVKDTLSCEIVKEYLEKLRKEEKD